MISVQDVSMRFGSKLLFEDVTTTFSKGRRYGLTGPNGSGKSTFMKLLTGESLPQKGTVVRPGQARRAPPGPVRLRRVPRHRHRHHGQRAALAGARRRARCSTPKPSLTDEDGMRLGELEGIVGEEDGYSAESDAAVLLQGLDIPTSCTSGRWPSCRADRRCASCWRRRCSAIPRRCCSTSRRTTSTSTRSTGCASS